MASGASAAAASGAGTGAPDPLRSALGSGTARINAGSFGLLLFGLAKWLESDRPGTRVLGLRLHAHGKPVGLRAADLIMRRHKAGERFSEFEPALNFVAKQCWKDLFGQEVSLIRNKGKGTSYYIIDNAPLCNKYVRRDGTGLAGFMAGVAEGLVCAMGFKATVAAKPLDGSPRSVAFLVTLE